MKINSIPPKDLYYQYVHAQKTAPVSARPQGTDKVELTEEAKLFSTALKAAKEALNRTPAELKRIEEIKQQVQSGTYSVSGRDVAEKLLK